MDNTNENKKEKEKNIIDDKWLENLQNEIKEQREDLERSKRINIKRQKIKKIYDEAVYGDFQFEIEDVLKYMEDRINFDDEEEKEAAKIYINAIKRTIDNPPIIKIEKGNQKNMDENKIVQALTDVFVPMFERIESRLDNIEADVKDIKVRLTNVELRLTNVETKLTNVELRLTNVESDVRDIKLQIETHVIPALNAQNEGRHMIWDDKAKFENEIEDIKEDIINLKLNAKFPGRQLIEK